MPLSPIVALAKEVVERYVQFGTNLDLAVSLSGDLPARAACFVSIHRRDGSLRGCIGTISPLERDLAHEVTRNAIGACSRDPRFPPVTADELEDLVYSVDVLSEPELVSSMDDLDPKQYGVIVELGWHRGLLLPDLRGVDHAAAQVRIALEKAGIAEGSTYRLSRFRVLRFH